MPNTDLPDLMDSDFSEKPKPRNISNSEVTTFLSCRRMYEFSFMQTLAPKLTPEPLARGSIGHHFLELYWRARMEGNSHDASVDAASEAFTNPCEPTTVDVLMKTQFFTMRFVEAHRAEWTYWRPVEVEMKHDLPITNSLNLTIKHDLYYEDLRTNKYILLDWKYAYDFWTLDDHDLNGQMPKYIAVLQANGFKVDLGMLAEIRTRELGKEKASDPKNLWRFTRYNPSRAKKKAVLQQHIAASLEIEEFRALDDDVRRLKAIPVLNKHGACKFCNFKDLCNAMNEGKTDLSVDIRVGYTQSTYGYNFDPVEIL